MILDLDVGNTAVKWRITDAHGEVQSRGRYLLEAKLPQSEFASVPITRARLSCVAGEEVRESLVQWVRERWDVALEIARPRAEYAGIRLAYADPGRLGVDRWLAMLAAYHRSPGPCCVMDCGSAITIDLVAGDGTHQGGYIVPGIQVQQRALLAGTKQIKLEEALGVPCAEAGAWGRSTEEGVRLGIYRMLESFLEAVIKEVQARPDCHRLIVTGGDGPRLLEASLASGQVTWCPELVLEGLPIALP